MTFTLFGETTFTYTVLAPTQFDECCDIQGILVAQDFTTVDVDGETQVCTCDPCETYDTNGTPGIQLVEAVAAVNDYFDFVIDLPTVVAVIDLLRNNLAKP